LFICLSGLEILEVRKFFEIIFATQRVISQHAPLGWFWGCDPGPGLGPGGGTMALARAVFSALSTWFYMMDCHVPGLLLCVGWGPFPPAPLGFLVGVTLPPLSHLAFPRWDFWSPPGVPFLAGRFLNSDVPKLVPSLIGA